jgi:hypothetical protein
MLAKPVASKLLDWLFGHLLRIRKHRGGLVQHESCEFHGFGIVQYPFGHAI